jgi:hypothetical protein
MRELYVDPDGVVQTGRSYSEGSAIVNGYVRNLRHLLATYSSSWGDDDMGAQFSKKFLEGMGVLEEIVTGVGETLDFTGEGLRGGGKAYQNADDDAWDAGVKLHKSITQVPALPAALPSAEQNADGHWAPAERAFWASHRPGETLGVRRRGELLEGRLREPGETIEGRPMKSEHRLLRGRVEQGETLAPADGLPVEAGERRAFRSVRPLEPEEPLAPGEHRAMRSIRRTGTGLMTSSFQMKATWGGATVDGYPIPAGYHLIAANELADGTVTMNTDGYLSISPLGTTHQAVDAQGITIVPDGGQQMFIVKENPDFTGIVPGQAPHYAKFAPDGSSIPYVPELETPDQAS